MRFLRTALLAAAGVSLAATAAYAATAKTHTMHLSLPDGSVATVRYVGDVAPHVVISPAQDVVAPIADLQMIDPAAAMANDMDAMFALVAQQNAQMTHEAAAMEQAAIAHGAAGESRQPGFAVTSAGPQGSYSYSLVSTTGADGCTRTVEWRADGAQAQPRMVQTASAACGAQKAPAAVPAKAEAPVEAAPAPGHKA